MPKITDSADRFPRKYPSDRSQTLRPKSELGNLPGACNSREYCLPQLRGGLQNRGIQLIFLWTEASSYIILLFGLTEPRRFLFGTPTARTPITATALAGSIEQRWESARPQTAPAMLCGISFKGPLTLSAFPCVYLERGTWLHLQGRHSQVVADPGTRKLGNSAYRRRDCRVGNTTSYSCGEAVWKNYSPTKFINTAEKGRSYACM